MKKLTRLLVASILPTFSLLAADLKITSSSAEPVVPQSGQPAPVASPKSAVRWICSTENESWKEMPAARASGAAVESPLTLDPETSYQVMDGFGACFNELGWEALISLPAEKREAGLEP